MVDLCLGTFHGIDGPHGSHAESCSKWRPFGAAKDILLSTICFFICVVVVIWKVNFCSLICVRLPWSCSLGKTGCPNHVIIIMNYCPFWALLYGTQSFHEANSLCTALLGVHIFDTDCRNKMSKETALGTMGNIWIESLQSHTTPRWNLYLHESTVLIWRSWFAYNGDMQVPVLMILVF